MIAETRVTKNKSAVQNTRIDATLRTGFANGHKQTQSIYGDKLEQFHQQVIFCLNETILQTAIPAHMFILKRQIKKQAPRQLYMAPCSALLIASFDFITIFTVNQPES